MYELIKKEYNEINKWDPMDTAIFSLMYDSGMTVNEIVNLEYGDFVESISEYIIDGELCPWNVDELYNYLQSFECIYGTWFITNPETGAKFQAFSFLESILDILDYLKSRGEEHVSLREPLFQCKYGGSISKDHVLSILEEMDEFLNVEGCIE